MYDKKPNSDNENQLWVSFDGKIKVMSKDLCFDTFEQRTINGTSIIASKINNEKTQLWTIEEIEVKSFFIQHQDSGL